MLCLRQAGRQLKVEGNRKRENLYRHIFRQAKCRAPRARIAASGNDLILFTAEPTGHRCADAANVRAAALGAAQGEAEVYRLQRVGIAAPAAIGFLECERLLDP